MQRLQLYPDIAPYRTGMLKVSEPHEVYYEECGNSEGKPALLLHGGPGGGADLLVKRPRNHYRSKRECNDFDMPPAPSTSIRTRGVESTAPESRPFPDNLK
mgnify:CR=1 FL=1